MKMTGSLCLLFLFIIPTLNAQPRGLKYSKHRNSIDLVIGGDFGFRILKGQNTDPLTQKQLANRDEFENYKLNYRFGLNYYQGISSNVLLKTGIRIANPGFNITNIDRIDPTQEINTINKSYLLQGFEYQYNYYFIEIPIGIKYVISKSACKPYIEVGIAPSFYLQTVVKETEEEGGSQRINLSENINTIHYFGTIASGGDFPIAKHLTGFSQLVARYQLNSLREGEVEERFIGLGLELGIRYIL